MTTLTKAFCQNCGHAKEMHYAHGQHPCVLCPSECLRYVSKSEAAEISKSLKQQMEVTLDAR